MRISTIAIAAGFGLACAGGVMLLSGKSPAENFGLNFSQPRHPVTAQMLKETSVLSKAIAPGFKTLDTSGAEIDISGSALKKPQLLLFIVDDCPCSVDAQPIFNRLYKHFNGSVEFIGVTNADAAKAKQWVHDNSPRFPIVSDPKLAIIHAYQARHSVYSALVRRDGRIEKMWPGYSVDMLREMNQKLAGAAGEAVRPFDPAYAPQEKTSGCAFYFASP